MVDPKLSTLIIFQNGQHNALYLITRLVISPCAAKYTFSVFGCMLSSTITTNCCNSSITLLQ